MELSTGGPVEPLCVICGEVTDVSSRELRSKGAAKLSEVAGKLEDVEVIERCDKNSCLWVHDECYKTYTAPKNINKHLRKKSVSSEPNLRSVQEKPYDYTTHCLICAQEINQKCSRKTSNIEMVSVENKSHGILQSHLLKVCEQRNDSKATKVKARIEFAGDLRAVEAKYHRDCMQSFTSERNIAHSKDGTDINVRNLNEQNNEAFLKLCEWMDSEEQICRQHSLTELRNQLQTYLPESVTPYSIRHLKRLLLQHFKTRIHIVEVSGRSNVVTLDETAASILHSTFMSDHEVTHDEIHKQVTEVGLILKEEIQMIDQRPDVFPTPEDVTIQQLQDGIPENLKQLIKSLFTHPRSSEAQDKISLLQVSLAHAIMNAAACQTYISPLLLSVGLFIHQSTRSRVIIDVLSSLGFCASYCQIMQFQKSAMSETSETCLPPGLTKLTDGGGFCQWVADNFDHNEDSATGHDSTHVMGIIACQTQESHSNPMKPIPRTRKSASEIITDGNFSDLILTYTRSSKSKSLPDIEVKSLQSSYAPINQFEPVDTLWLYSSLLCDRAPNWQGFMAEVTSGDWQCTSVVYCPMIPLNPSGNDAIYSTMKFVTRQAEQLGMCCASITFDQPLYQKSMMIKHSRQDEFKDLYIRLGGFHQLMAFLGTICKLMEVTGLEEIWRTAYAENSLPKMMDGKAYVKVLRAVLLTDAALHIVLLEDYGSVHEESDCQNSISGETESCITGDVFNSENKQDDSSKHQCADPMLHESQIPSSVHELLSAFPVFPDDETITNKPGGQNANFKDETILQEDVPSEANMNKDMWSTMEKIYREMRKTCSYPEQASEHLTKFHAYIQKMKSSVSKSRTAKLWLMFMDMAAIVRMFIRAERTGNWNLHLQATQMMLPYFSAAGRINYAKCCRLYLQESHELCNCLQRPFQEGKFTVRRNSNLFWSGTWSDMIIEQSLMRSGKTHGGLINITHKESARTKWLLTAHVIAQYSEALRSLTNTFTGTWSEQHREMNANYMKRDNEHLQLFLGFIRKHDPFRVKDEHQLVNIATGIIADERVNVETSLEIGKAIQEQLTGKKFSEITMKRKEQAQTFKVMQKPVKVAGEDVFISSTELYQRLLATSYTQGQPTEATFSYELAAVVPSLFTDDGHMRNTPKSNLSQFITHMGPGIICEINKPTVVVIDGCALLHSQYWPKIGTIGTLCDCYVQSVMQRKSLDVPAYVIFDCYAVRSTKDQAQKRRRLNKFSPDMALDLKTPIPSDKTKFLANRVNKQELITLISHSLEDAGIEVEHADEEGDADVVIIRRALDESVNSKAPIKVVADDTDILVLLLHHATSEMYMETKQHTLSINMAKEILGREMCMCLPFVHAMSGCDTTSAFYGIGKLKHMKLLMSSQKLRSDVLIFGDNNAKTDDILGVGLQYVSHLYQGDSLQPVKPLNELRFLYITSPTKYVPIERVPPTERACQFHCLRVNFQVSTWRNLKTVLKFEDYGYKFQLDGSIEPIMTDMPVAPPELLINIKCSCKVKICVSCNCSKKRLPCTIHCKCRGQCSNSANSTIYLNDDDDNDNDDDDDGDV